MKVTAVMADTMSTKVRKVMMNMKAREFSLSLTLEKRIFKVPMLLIQVAWVKLITS